MTFSKATKELARLKALNDGKDYCMTMAFSGGWSVGERTAKQKDNLSQRDPGIDAMTGGDYLASYSHEENVH